MGVHLSYKIEFPGERCSFSSQWSQKISNNSSTVKGRKLKKKIIWQLRELESRRHNWRWNRTKGKQSSSVWKENREAEGQKAARKVWDIGAPAANRTGTS